MERKKKILLVDDDVDFVDLNKAVLKNHGFEVLVAFSGKEGLDKVKFEEPDLIVLDLMLERHDTGFGFAQALKGDPRYSKIPILLLTAVAETTGYDFSQEIDGYWMKTDDYASKPLIPEELVKRITALLARAKEKG